ncbi:RNA-binding protein 25-like [Gracilinanus agilis]|uniref:RNA-binding protein 25-like n=1 Tax=Gracilinanus agilis TaxID=191870 RepID=UPI001CFE307E|nr:RNA-binding protein 25-like [Gracilinanus agilis]
MSFPPHLNRPPMRIPALPPGVQLPQFPGFPLPVPPVTPMSFMTPAPTVLVPTVSMVGKHLGARKDHPGLENKENDGNSGPTTTVFVGNISEKASDTFIRQLLAKCGLVLSWKRVQSESGKLQVFGFCEYKEPESTLCALRLLHDLQIGEKKLLVKVGEKTKAQLDEWKVKRKASNGNAKSESTNDDDEALDEETKRRDQIIKGAIEVLIQEYFSELNASSQKYDSHPKKKKGKKEDIFCRFPVAPLIPYPLITKEDINAIEMEEDKRDLLSREINKYRDTHKKLGEEKSKKEKERQETEKEQRERQSPEWKQERERERERKAEKEHEWKREPNRDPDRTKERDREAHGESERSSNQNKYRSKSREKHKDREWQQEQERERERERKKKERDRQEDAYQRRKLERKLREKEAAYQKRLKNWEIRERKKTREYEKEAGREEERRREMTEEAKLLKEFLEDYDDDRDNPKYYRVSSVSGNVIPHTPGNESPYSIIILHENSPDQQQPEKHKLQRGLNLKLGVGVLDSSGQPNAVKRKKLPVGSVFNKFEDEDSDAVPQEKLVPLDYGEDDKNCTKGTVNTEEKHERIKSLIEKIPRAKSELFAYPLDWSIVDSTLMKHQIRPWINKKIIEYVGEEEAVLVDFVCSKVMAHSSPQSILDDVAIVLDEEAEGFIVKMWRLLIYETEAKKIGLVK